MTAKKTRTPKPLAITNDAKFLGAKLDKIIALLKTQSVPVELASTAEPVAPNDDGIFRDNKLLQAKDGSLYTLEWSPTLDGTFNYADAAKACVALRLGGHSDWYLPERFELESLLDLMKHAPASSAPNTKSSWYWSATKYASSPSGCAWLVNFSYGIVYWNYQLYSGLVRACRRVPARQ